MGLAIYQIGDTPIFFDLKEINDESPVVKGDREWRNATLELTGVPGVHSFSDPLRPLAEKQTITISGSFVCDEKSAQQLYSRLMSMGGIANTPLIGFRYEECEHSDSNVCCSNCNNTLDWIVTYGTIEKIDQESVTISSKRPWTNNVIPIKISMTVNSKWRALNAWEWEYRRSPQVLNTLDPNLERDSMSNLFVLPDTFSGLNKKGHFFKWGLLLSKYDPLFWESKYTNSRKGGYGLNFNAVGKYPFVSDPNLWNAQPNSVYAFSSFSNVTGSIGIEVTKNTGYFANTGIVETSTLDLSDLHADLIAIGQGGLLLDDVVVTGYASPFPGFVIRNDEIIEGIRPRWTYPGNYPGETGRGYNGIEFTSSDVNVQVAFLHDFGMY